MGLDSGELGERTRCGRADTGMVVFDRGSLVGWAGRAPERSGSYRARAGKDVSLDRVMDDKERSLASVQRAARKG